MDFRLEAGKGRPLYLQLRDRLRVRLLTGVLPAGRRLPATRELAKSLHISRNTVEEAYALLVEEGLIEIRRGRGAFAKAAHFDGLDREEEAPLAIDWSERITPALRDLADYRSSRGRLELKREGAVSFTSMAPDHHEFEIEAFRRALNDVLAREGAVLLAYGYTRGYEPLRAYVREYLAGKGLRMAGQQVLICDGFRQGAAMAVRALCRPGDCVAVENPTYNGFLGVLRTQEVEACGVACDEQGMIPEALEEVIERRRPKMLYVVPTYHNPTGRNIPLERRRRLLAVAEAHGLPVLEDGFSEELRFAGESYPALKALDERGNVLYVGSFSKILFPGLRIGWLVVPEGLFGMLEHLKYNENISSPPLTQAALYEYCRRGGLERHLRRCRPVYRSRMEAMHDALEERFTGRAAWRRSEGGFGAWLEFPEAFDARAALVKAREAGVLYAPGDAFFPDGSGRNFIRLGFSRLSEEDIRRGIATLSDVFAGEGF